MNENHIDHATKPRAKRAAGRERERVLLVIKGRDGVTRQEIASELGLPLEVVQKRVAELKMGKGIHDNTGVAEVDGQLMHVPFF